MDGSKTKEDTEITENTPHEISYADGALELEAPEDGATIENPPNGGQRAWLIVLSCTGINVLQTIVFILIRASLVIDDSSSDIMSTDTGIESEELEDVSDQFLNMSDIYAPFAAFVMIFLGYGPTVCIGAGVVTGTLFFLSYIGDDDTEHFIKFLIYGPIAVGISFIRLGALIPVLEYFTTKRLKALFLSRLGLYIGELILIGFLFIPGLTFKWRVCLRGASAICIGIGLIGLTLKDLKLKMKDDESVTFVQRTLGLAKKDILKNILFWVTCVVYLFYHWGIEAAQAEFNNLDVAKRLNLGDNRAKQIFFGFSQPIGMLIGMALAWLFKKAAIGENSRLQSVRLRNDPLLFIFGILVVNGFTMGIGCFIAPHAVNFGYMFTFSLTYGAFFAFCEGLRDDVIPEQFGRDNTRIVEGLILMSVGLGGIVTNEISAEIDNGKDDDWKNIFRYGGGMLLFSAAVTSLVLFLKRSKVLDEITAKLNGNSVSPLQKTEDNRQAARRELEEQPKGPRKANNRSTYNSNQERNGDTVYRSEGEKRDSASNQPVQPMSMYDL